MKTITREYGHLCYTQVAWQYDKITMRVCRTITVYDICTVETFRSPHMTISRFMYPDGRVERKFFID